MCPNGATGLVGISLGIPQTLISITGHAWSDQETRSLLSDTAQLHRKLNEMSQRIRQLEDALEISHTLNSSNQHPLLREELLAIKRCVAPAAPAAKEPSPAEVTEQADGDYVEAMGTMSISDRGVTRFIGGSGGSESLIMVCLSEMTSAASSCE